MDSIKQAEWVIGYYGAKLYLTDLQHKAFLDGIRNKLSIIEIDDLLLTVRFAYLVHTSELEADRLNDEEHKWAMIVAEWLSRPVNQLDMERSAAEKYSKKLVKRIGVAQVKKLWNRWAECAYPSPIKFMSGAKDMTSGELSEGKLLLGE